MVVQHNLTAINANRYLGINNTKLSKSLEKLSSGYAINRAGDNAAGLAVSEKMRAQIGGINQAVKNAEDGISMVQTFEGALNETDNILQRMKTLATQSANGTYDDNVDRAAIQLEFDQLNDELDQIADTDYNGIVALNGGRMADGSKTGTTSTGATQNIGYKSASPVSGTAPATGSTAPAGSGTANGTASTKTVTTGISVSNAFSGADATMIYTKSIILQAGGRGKDSVNFTFDYSAYTNGFSGGTYKLEANMNVTSGASGLDTRDLYLGYQAEANDAMDRIDYAINKVSMVRATFGAIQNRLEHKIDNLNTTSENLTAAESRIRDTDMAKEMMNFTKNQILAQASQSMLAQANQLPQGALSLLQ